MSLSVLAPFGLNPAAQQSTDPVILPTPQFVSGTLDVAGMNPIRASGLVHSWDDIVEEQVTTVSAAAAYDDEDTSINVDNVNATDRVLSFQAGDIVRTALNENILITAVTAQTTTTATWTIVRGYQGTDADIIADNSALTRQYAAVPGDASSYPVAALNFLSTDSAATTNYFQSIYRQVTLTRDLLRLKGYGNSMIAQIARPLADAVLRDLERAVTLGLARASSPQGITAQGAVMKGWQPLAPATSYTVDEAVALWEFVEIAYGLNRGSNLLIAGKTAAQLLRGYVSGDLLHFPSNGGCGCGGGPAGNGKSRSIGTLMTQYGPWSFIVSPHISAALVYSMSVEDLRLVIGEPLQVRKRETSDAGLTIVVGGTFTLRYGNPATWKCGTVIPS